MNAVISVPILTAPPGNVHTSAVSDCVRSALHPDEGGGPSAVMDEGKLNWKSTAFATAKLLLRGVRDSADAFGPLKSVAGGLCFILENCEVWFSIVHYPQCLQKSQRMKANNQAIESLAPRVKTLAESLCTPISEGDTKEQDRRMKLER